jgi:hypothetical protein
MTAIFSFCLQKYLRNLPAYNLLCDEETITVTPSTKSLVTEIEHVVIYLD